MNTYPLNVQNADAAEPVPAEEEIILQNGNQLHSLSAGNEEPELAEQHEMAEPRIEKFHVHDSATANWVIRKICAARAYREHVDQWAVAEIRRAEREEQFLFTRFGAELESWASKELAGSGGRSQSINLPAGRIGFRKKPPAVAITDDAELHSWLQDNLPAAISLAVQVAGSNAPALRSWCETNLPAAKISNHVAKSTIRQHIQMTGEAPPGVQLIGGREFYVR